MPTSYYDLLAMSPDELAKVDIAMLNLLWRRQPRAAMKRHTPRQAADPSEFGRSKLAP